MIVMNKENQIPSLRFLHLHGEVVNAERGRGGVGAGRTQHHTASVPSPPQAGTSSIGTHTLPDIKNKGIFSPLTRFPYVITISSGIKTPANLHRNGHYGFIWFSSHIHSPDAFLSLTTAVTDGGEGGERRRQGGVTGWEGRRRVTLEINAMSENVDDNVNDDYKKSPLSLYLNPYV